MQVFPGEKVVAILRGVVQASVSDKSASKCLTRMQVFAAGERVVQTEQQSHLPSCQEPYRP